MQKINWQNGELIKEAFVTIDDVEYEVTPRQTSSGTPLSANNLNLMQDNIEDAIDDLIETKDKIEAYLKLFSKTLWQGNATSSSTIRITDARKYSSYIVHIDINGGSDPVPVFCGREEEQGNYIEGGMTTPATTTSEKTFCFMAENLGQVGNTDDENWQISSVEAISHNASGNHSSISEDYKVVKVIGLLPKTYV